MTATKTERETWLRERRNGLGATDLAAIAGVGFQDARDIYLDKIGETPLSRPVAPLLRMGLITEPLNAELYCERFDIKEMAAPGLVWSKAVPWMFSTLDRIAVKLNDTDFPLRPVELKYTPFFGDYWGEEGTDQVPDGYAVQTTWQSAILSANNAPHAAPHISAIDSRANHRVYTVPFNPRLAGLLIELGEVFWNRVKNREEVGPDWSHPLRERIAEEVSIFEPDTSFQLDTPDALECVNEIDRLAEVKATGEEAEQRIKLLKTKLRIHLGSNECGVLPDGRRVKQYAVEGMTVKPSPYYREPRTDVRILKAVKLKKAKV